MTRITKKADERWLEIINTANELFLSQGYEKTSVELIIQTINIAKGTFYYYFKSKEELLEAVVNHTLDNVIKGAQRLLENTSLNALEKLKILFTGQGGESREVEKVKEELHKPANRELHEKNNVQIVKRFSPLVAEIIQQGIREGVFQVENVLETVQFVLAASQFLFDEALFDWSQAEWKTRRQVMQDVIEKSFGAKKGSFSFLQKR